MGDESVLRARAREAMKAGNLPGHRPDRMWGGPGTTARSACRSRPWRPGAAPMAGVSVTARATVAIAAAAGPLAVLRLVHPESAAVEVDAVQRLHRPGSVGVRHLHKAEAARAARLAVGDEGHFLHRPMLGKQGADGLFGGREGKISNV